MGGRWVVASGGCWRVCHVLGSLGGFLGGIFREWNGLVFFFLCVSALRGVCCFSWVLGRGRDGCVCVCVCVCWGVVGRRRGE